MTTTTMTMLEAINHTLRLYVTQVDDNGNDAISIDEWLEFWRNVLAQVTLASQQASHQPKVTLTHPRARVTRPEV